MGHLLEKEFGLGFQMDFDDFRLDQKQFQMEILKNLKRLQEDPSLALNCGIDMKVARELDAVTRKNMLVSEANWYIPVWKIELIKEIGRGGYHNASFIFSRSVE